MSGKEVKAGQGIFKFAAAAGPAGSAKDGIYKLPSGTKAVVRLKTCKTILNKTSIDDYSLNCYTGCMHGCVYCYARFMQRFCPHSEGWGRFVDVKVNAVEILARQLKRAGPGEVFVSSACDGWQPIEEKLQLTRQCCKLLVDNGFELYILTKNALVLRDLDVFAGRKVSLGVTITTLDEKLRALFEPNASSVKGRLEVLRQAKKAGLKTSVMFGPLLPFVWDSQKAVDGLFEQAAELKVDSIWVDALNRRPKVWESLSPFLRKNFPDLQGRYRDILFGDIHRREYLGRLAKTVRSSAERYHLAARTKICF